MIKIFTDSTSYIPKVIQKKLDITVLPLSVSLDNKHFLETEISNTDFFNLMDNSDNFPKSSQPETDLIYKKFMNSVEKGDTIVGIFISSKMSGTYSTCNLAKNMILEKYPDAQIHLVDSESNCMQMGLAVVAAASTAQKGESIANVLNAAYDTMRRSRFLFIPNTLAYLEKGGRIGKASALIGSVLNIIPILTVIEGETSTLLKVRTHKKAVEKMLATLKKDMENLNLDKIIVCHINALDKAKKLLDSIKGITDIIPEISDIGPVIGAHVGPKTIGIVYKTKKVHPLNASVTLQA